MACFHTLLQVFILNDLDRTANRGKHHSGELRFENKSASRNAGVERLRSITQCEVYADSYLFVQDKGNLPM